MWDWSKTVTRAVRIVGLLPLLWFAVTLGAGAAGVWWETAGDVIVFWNFWGALGLALVVPSVIFTLGGATLLRSPATFRRGRGYVTAGLGLAIFLYLLVISGAIAEIVNPPPDWHRELPSMLPWLTSSEHAALAVPYAAMLAAVSAVLIVLWRPPATQADRVNTAA